MIHFFYLFNGVKLFPPQSRRKANQGNYLFFFLAKNYVTDYDHWNEMIIPESLLTTIELWASIFELQAALVFNSIFENFPLLIMLLFLKMMCKSLFSGIHFSLIIWSSVFAFVIPCVSGIMTWVTNLLSQSTCVFRQKYRTEKYLLHHKVMLPHSVQHSVFQFHNTYIGWTNQCNYYKIACINMLWQHNFGWSPKILQFNILIGKHQWRSRSLALYVWQNVFIANYKENLYLKSTVSTAWFFN